MKYYICHNSGHVSAGRDCTTVPYSDVQQYSSYCNPVRLELIGMVEETHSAKRPEQFICVAKDHVRCGYVCTQDPAGRAMVTATGGHEFVPHYEAGTWISVRMQVDGSQPDKTKLRNEVWVKCEPLGYRIPRAYIMGAADPMCPPEPDRKLLLKSKQDGSLVHHTGSWKKVGAIAGMDWEDIWNNYGPFDVFTPSGEIVV